MLCLRPWDFRALVPISLVSGRRVGRGSRMVGWMQARLDNIAARQGSPATSLASLLNRTLGISARRLELTSELNGGVLVFNNLRLTRVRWLSRCVAAYAGLREVIEGDQDLIALILAADGSLPRVNLPDRATRLPPRPRPAAAADRPADPPRFLRARRRQHPLCARRQAVAGNLTDYPMYLIAARLQHVDEWRGIARDLAPPRRHGALRREQRLLGPDGLAPLSLADGNAGRCVGRQRAPVPPRPRAARWRAGGRRGAAAVPPSCAASAATSCRPRRAARRPRWPKRSPKTTSACCQSSKIRLPRPQAAPRRVRRAGLPAPAWEREICARDWEELERARARRR